MRRDVVLLPLNRWTRRFLPAIPINSCYFAFLLTCIPTCARVPEARLYRDRNGERLEGTRITLCWGTKVKFHVRFSGTRIILFLCDSLDPLFSCVAHVYFKIDAKSCVRQRVQKQRDSDIIYIALITEREWRINNTLLFIKLEHVRAHSMSFRADVGCRSPEFYNRIVWLHL